MRSCTTIRTTVLLFLLIDLGASANAQATGDSPYSAYGFGDLLTTGQVSQALMAGTGLAIAEPYGVLLGNPASYGALHRPVFEVGVAARHTRASSATESSSRNDVDFTGFTIGVPFAKGKWGLAMGLTPFSEVGYSTARNADLDGETVKYEYTGSGGLDRAFFGLAHTVYRQAADTLGNIGSSVLVGADFNFIFGSIEQTRNAVYPSNGEYTNLRAFSSLVLRSPTADASVIWQGDLTKKKDRDDDNWRWSVGASVAIPASFRAHYSDLVSTYVSNNGVESLRDTVQHDQEVKGSVEFPMGIGLGVGVRNARWALTAEVKQRDWGAATIDVPGYGLPAPLRTSISYAAAARFHPASEGNVLHRAVYRAGLRHTEEPQQVRGTGLTSDAFTLGASFPLNAVQTNSWFHIGGEFGQRGSTANGLLKEQYATLWIGVAFTPWRRERWFSAPKIQ